MHFYGYQLIGILVGLTSMCCTAQEDTKYIYLSDYDVILNGDERCQKFLKTHAIHKTDALYLPSSIQLVFRDDTLHKIFYKSNHLGMEHPLREDEVGFRYVYLEPNNIYIFEKADTAECYLGGEVPQNFKIPTFNFVAPFQYIGKISKDIEAFSWLPFDLHLVAPLYNNFYKVYIDYSDPMNPQVLNVDDLKEAGTSFDALRPNTEVVYNKEYFKVQRSRNFDSNIGHAGVPDWIQVPRIPLCPKSDKAMKFLCQFNSNTRLKTKRTNIQLKNERFNYYFEHLDFWGYGRLYVFFEPQSKIACYIIQNT